MSLLNTFKNPWACENTIHGSGFKGMELELFYCPKCGSEPSMVDEYPSGIGMICINCKSHPGFCVCVTVAYGGQNESVNLT